MNTYQALPTSHHSVIRKSVEIFLFIILEASARLHHNKQYHPRHAIILHPNMGYLYRHA